ncbi:RING finger protein 207 isoform X3 [Columba livia]|uniref:RING finger protein 207 isoform X3 n=1 Tax=Columba livia TaxID=8932 RepID=UPI0031BA0143
MAGGIFSPLGSCSELEKANCHPLVCLLCHEPYQHPCLLDCYHNFCASCLRGRASDGRLCCPLCGHPSVVRGGTGLPPVDRLLQFLVDSSADGEEDVQCANCDRCCAKAELDTMYFCNTCGQPLCAPCREETHRAKMFARHEIVSLSKRTKDIHKKCPLHEEPYIMFSTEKKSMLCINCFRDMQGESRAHCIDIETAYMQGCQRLDQAVMAVKELQTSTREAIVLLKAMIEEEQLSERKKTLLKAVQSQHEEKEKAFKEQLAHLASLLPTLQVHLVTCSAFLSSANKAEFLDLGYQLMERLQRIVKLPHRLRPAQTSKINSEYRAEFARCLEPLLMLSPRRSVVGSAGGIGPGIASANMLPGGQCSKTLMVPGCPPVGDKMSTSPMVRKPTMHRYISTKVLLAEGRETPFAEHCRNYENTYRMLQTEIQGLKDQVQELHRDLTKHHSLIKTEIMSEILQKSLQMDVQIAAHYSAVEMMRSVFEEVWEETYQRVANEQEIYEGCRSRGSPRRNRRRCCSRSAMAAKRRQGTPRPAAQRGLRPALGSTVSPDPPETPPRKAQTAAGAGREAGPGAAPAKSWCRRTRERGAARCPEPRPGCRPRCAASEGRKPPGPGPCCAERGPRVTSLV